MTAQARPQSTRGRRNARRWALPCGLGLALLVASGCRNTLLPPEELVSDGPAGADLQPVDGPLYDGPPLDAAGDSTTQPDTVLARDQSPTDAPADAAPQPDVAPDSAAPLADGPAADTGCSPSSLTFIAVADTTVDEGFPGQNFGTGTLLSVDSKPDQHIYLRFQVAGISAPVTGVRLRLYVKNSTVDGPTAQLTSSGWQETSLSWNTRPGPSGPVLGDYGNAPAGWAELALGPALSSDGPFSLVLMPTSGDGMDVSSREDDAPPQLLVDLCGP